VSWKRSACNDALATFQCKGKPLIERERLALLLLDNPIQNYAWGSRTSLAQLLGRPASSQPEAELWIGAHPKAPSRLSDGRSLHDAIAADPAGMLGSARERFGAELPFLLKVLAVDAPLSLQAHPNLEQAARGFAREELARVPIDAAARTYKDKNHKPELLCALTPFEALCGFRPPAESASLLGELGVTAFSLDERARATSGIAALDLAAELRSGAPDALATVFSRLMTLPRSARSALTAEVLARCERAQAGGGLSAAFRASVACALALGARYPGDVGVVASLLLNHVRLEPLQAIYLEAGRLHAYVSGMGVEIMANSDNVLRGGLTPKHVDVPELLGVLRFDSAPVRPTPTARSAEGEVCYETPAPEFRLSRIDLREQPFHGELRGPEILLCVEGQASVELAHRSPATPRLLRRGQACFLPASLPSYELRGSGRVFRATVGSEPA
jgi:mannose-6-phosphate isomerase